MIPQRRLTTRVLSNWSRRDRFVAFLIVLSLVGVFNLLGLYVTAIVLIIGVTFLYRRRDGFDRVYGEVGRDIYGSVVIDRILDGVLWSAEQVGKPFERWVRNRRSAIPFRITQVRAKIDGALERYGLLQQLDRPFEHIFLAADGGAFANLDIETQTEAVNTLAHVTNTVMLRGELKVGVTYLRISGPYDPTDITINQRLNGNPFLNHPELFNLDAGTVKWANLERSTLNEIREAATQERATKNWMLIVVTIQRSLSKSKLSKGEFSNRQLANLPIIELGRAFVEALQNTSLLGLTNVRCLGMAELSHMVRASWDKNPDSINVYYKARSQGMVPRTEDDIDTFRAATNNDPDKMDAYLQAWPTKIIRVSGKEKCAQLDDNYLSAIRINMYPNMVRSDQFMALQYKLSRRGTWLSRGMIGEGISSSAETNRLIIGESALVNFQNAFNQGKIIEHPEVARRRKDARQQTNQISSQSVAQLFNQIWIVSATSYEELDIARREVKATLEAEGFGCKIVSPVGYMMDAVLTGMLGANRL